MSQHASHPVTRRPLPARIWTWAMIGVSSVSATVAMMIGAPLTHNVVLWGFGGVAGLALLGVVAYAGRKVIRWRCSIWLRQYLCKQREAVNPDEPIDVLFYFCDHFEPEHGNVESERQLARVRRWEEAYRNATKGHVDSDGRSPQHTWFFPIAIASPEVRPVLARWPGYGWGEIEYHIHHGASCTVDQLRSQIGQDIAGLQDMGAVSSGRYGFVHGMFALAGGDPRHCRLPEELDILMETGCYADFTFPAIGTPAQPRQVNSIYHARTTGGQKPYDTGAEAQAGQQGEGLLLIPGPMWAGWSRRVFDDAHLAPSYPPHPCRIDRWLHAHVHVKGRPNWIFVGVHSHTGKETNQDMLFSGPMQTLWTTLEGRFKGSARRLHSVTAREAYNIVRAAEAGRDGNPNGYRDIEIPPPANRLAANPAEDNAPAEGQFGVDEELRTACQHGGRRN